MMAVILADYRAMCVKHMAVMVEGGRHKPKRAYLTLQLGLLGRPA